MAWTAEIVNKGINATGKYFVDIQFTDGSITREITIQNSKPTTEWVPLTVKTYIERFEAVDAFDIPLGAILPADDPMPGDPNIALLMKRMELMSYIKVLVDMGFVPPDNAKIQQFGNWIVNNFNDYIDQV